MASTSREIVLRALEREIGDAQDNLIRAEMSFRGRNLDAEYGESGETRRHILDQYRERVTETEAAKKWFADLPHA